ncbi:MAG: acyl carrier protein [Eubacteriales bacterium]|nr:acyl carrier protein [Eubacteriales bacterium]
MFEKLKEVIVDNLNCDEEKVTPEANLKDDLDADSLDAVELSMAIEEEFDVVVPENAMKDFETVGDILKFLENYES